MILLVDSGPWSDCKSMQSDLGLHYLHMPEDTFSHSRSLLILVASALTENMKL